VTVLIVEETAAMCRLIRRLVDGLPVSITECVDGREALALCLSLRPDWVLLDLDLAGTDALAATRQIRDACPAIRVAVLGADDSPRLRLAAQQAGARAYVAKGNLFALQQVLFQQ
jgi:CheY-like chemotaxis protein